MKHLGKILLLVLSLALLCGAVFAFSVGAEDGTVTEITSEAELSEALTAGGDYKLANNITITSEETALTVGAGVSVTIDMNECVIIFKAANSISVPADATLSMTNGDVFIMYSEKGTEFRTMKLIQRVLYDEETQTYSYDSNATNKVTSGSTSTYADYGWTDDTASESFIDDIYQEISYPAFQNYGSLALDGVNVTRTVGVSYGGEMFALYDGSTTVLNAGKFYISGAAQGWTALNTRMFYLERGSGNLSLSLENCYLDEVTPTATYTAPDLDGDDEADQILMGGLYSTFRYGIQAIGSVDASTGKITYRSNTHLLYNKDDLYLLYVGGSATGTVNISIDNTYMHSQCNAIHGTFAADDTVTVTNSYYKQENLTNSNSHGFNITAGTLTLRTTYAEATNMINLLGNSAKTTCKIENCYLAGTHMIRDTKANGEIYIKDSYLKGAMRNNAGKVYFDGTVYTNYKIVTSNPGSSNGWYNVYHVDDTKTNIYDGTAATDSDSDGTNDTYLDNATAKGWIYTTSLTVPKAAVVSGETTTLYSTVADAVADLKEGDTITTWLASTATLNQKNISWKLVGSTSVITATPEVMETLTLDAFSAVTAHIVSGDTTTYYVNSSLSTIAGLLTAGDTLVLDSDISASTATIKVDASVDLAGHVIRQPHSAKNMAFRIQSGAAVNFYSSKEGAVFYGNLSLNSTGSYFAEVQSGVVGIGYQSLTVDESGEITASEKSPYDITYYCGTALQISGGSAYVNGGIFHIVGGDNKGAFVLRGSNTNEKYLRFDNTKIYTVTKMVVDFCALNTMTHIVDFNNCEIYAEENADPNNVNIGGTSKHGGVASPEGQVINLNSTKIYGGLSVRGISTTTINVDESCAFGKLTDLAYVNLPEGYALVPDNTVSEISFDYPLGAGFRNTIVKTADSYATTTKVAPVSEYQKSVMANVALEANIKTNLYVPVSGLSDVTVDGVKYTVDTESTKVIGDVEYAIITIAKAPKVAYESANVTVTYKTDSKITTYASFDYTLTDYMEALLAIDPTGKTQADYITDSQALAKTVLYYVKSVITAYGDTTADTATIDALLGDYTFTTPAITEEVKNVEGIVNLQNAAMDLDASVGMAFLISNTFTGTIEASIDGQVVASGSYETAAADNYFYVSDLNIADYRKDVTLTITPTEGEAETVVYNLATYVSRTEAKAEATAEQKAAAWATYAYSAEAEVYCETYNTVSTIE